MKILKNGAYLAKGFFRLVDLVWHSVEQGKVMLLQPIVKHMPSFVAPNLLSWFRIGLAFCIAIMLFWYDTFRGVVIACFVIAVFSDILDGEIARKHQQTTGRGAFLDRLGDKMIVCPLVICFLWRYYVLTSLVVAVEFLSLFVLVGAESNPPAKWKMIAEGVGLIVVFLFPQKIAWARVAFICALVFGAISFREYRISFRARNGAE